MAIAVEALRGMRRILSHRSAPPAAVKEAETPRFTSIEAWASSGQAATASELGRLVPETGKASINLGSLGEQTRELPLTTEEIVFTGPEHPQVREVTSRFREHNSEYAKKHGLK